MAKRSSQEVEGDTALQERDHVMSVGFDGSARQEVGKQTVGAPAGLAADMLHTDVIDLQNCAGLSIVGAPADQGVRAKTVTANKMKGKK